MVLIHTDSAGLNKLRSIGLDIVQIRTEPPPEAPTNKATFQVQTVVVEAVVRSDQLAKLKALGYDISEVP